MDPFGGGDEEDRDSEGSSENEQDGPMDDRDEEEMDGNGAPDGDGEGEVENEEDNEDEDDEQEQLDSQYSMNEGLNRGERLARASQTSLHSGGSESMQGPNGPAPTSHPNPSMLLTSPSSTQPSTITNGFGGELPQIRPEVLSASLYDIIPTIAAPHSTSINSITATPDLRWVFTGGADGYIRKFNWLETANGKTMLTVAQRHPFVDSVTKAGALVSYWENNEESSGKSVDDNSSISSVYSLAVQRDGLWLLSGLESGGINLQSVRIDEGKRIARLAGHTSAVSVLNLARDERSVLSGSWDKNVIDWDLNVGKQARSFEGSGGQISALETRPSSSLPVPEALGDIVETKGTFSSDSESKERVNHRTTDGLAQNTNLEPLFGEDGVNGNIGSPNDSLFGGNDGDSLFGDNENETGAPSAGNFIDDDDEFSRAIANGLRDQAEEGDQPQGTATGEPNGDIQMMDAGEVSTAAFPTEGQNHKDQQPLISGDDQILSQGVSQSTATLTNGLPHVDEGFQKENSDGISLSKPEEGPQPADSVFLAAAIDGSIRVWDKRQHNPVAKITPQNVPPWCMNATWSPDGNLIYAGRRNGTVDEYSLHKGLRGAERSFKLPNNSGPVSALRAMPNGRHLICASYDILRLYDLQQQQIFKHATVPFLIVPGHRTGVVASLYMDPTCRYLISAAGNRGWEGSTTEVLLGYEIGVPK